MGKSIRCVIHRSRFSFILTSIMLGVGLAMDAFSVSLANGLHEPRMRKKKMFVVAGVFAGFQALMPMIGWICVHTIVQYFQAFEKIIPWIALILLAFIGGKMLIEGIENDEEVEVPRVGLAGLIIGKKFGTKFSNKATIFGGVILIIIGLEIFITGVF